MKRYLLISLAVLVAVIALVILTGTRNNTKDGGKAQITNVPALVNRATLDSLPVKSASVADTSHLASGLLPPTNCWISGMVLQKIPQPVYPLPLSFLAKNNGFQIGLPTVTSSPAEISGEFQPGIMAQLPATTFRLTRFDKISATLTYFNGLSRLGNLTLAEGSPFVFYQSFVAGILNLTSINPSSINSQTDHYLRYNLNGHNYVLNTNSADIHVSNVAVSVRLKPGSSLALYALPGSADPLRPYANNLLSSVATHYTKLGRSIDTTFTYHTANDKPTVFAPLPYTNISGNSIASYQSIYGPMPALVGKSFTSSVPAITPSSQLDLAKLTASQKQNLTAMLEVDTKNTNISDQDSYFAGKELARAANLLSIAEQLGQKSIASQLKQTLANAFASRLTPKYFYYDSTLKGVAAQTADFGSQNFNDHHFHYGYWLYAGSILGKYDPNFLSRDKDMLNLLAADIASYQTSGSFPVSRYYDAYAEHSWADGLAPFADGNDEESSSEAIHAWNGVTLWGQVTSNRSLVQVGQWMLANEYHSAAAIWRNVDVSSPNLKGYTSPLVDITFGGKRVYSTWFSASPAAKLGIQLIPMDPTMAGFVSDKNISAKVAASIAGNNFNVSLGDYALMYLSLKNPKQASQLAQQQTNIDNGDSKTYLNAFIYAQLDKGY